MKSKISCLLFLLGLGFLCGCLENPIHLHAQYISKQQVDILKTAIIDEGYQRISKENFPHEGAICTAYAKKVSHNGTVCEVGIMVTFKTIDDTPDMYRNLGVSIGDDQGRSTPKIKTEAERIEGILYKKLVELTSEENVQRGEPRPTKKVDAR